MFGAAYWAVWWPIWLFVDVAILCACALARPYLRARERAERSPKPAVAPATVETENSETAAHAASSVATPTPPSAPTPAPAASGWVRAVNQTTVIGIAGLAFLIVLPLGVDIKDRTPQTTAAASAALATSVGRLASAAEVQSRALNRLADASPAPAQTRNRPAATSAPFWWLGYLCILVGFGLLAWSRWLAMEADEHPSAPPPVTGAANGQ